MLQRNCARVLATTTLLLVVVVISAGTASAQNLFTSQTPEFSQNVKTVLFPFNVYNRVENPDVLRADADWLKQHPGIEFVSRDRCGLYAQGIRQGAPSARQVADRFHLMQNLRENIEREMTSVSRGGGRP